MRLSARVTRSRRRERENARSNAGEGPDRWDARGEQAGLEYRGHRKCSSGINKAIVDYGSDTQGECVCLLRTEEGEQAAARGDEEGGGRAG